MRVRDDAAVLGAKDDAPKAYLLGASWSLCFGVLGRAHCEEVCSQRYVSGLCVSWVLKRPGVTSEQLIKFSKEFWCDCFLASGRRIGVVERFQE